MGSEKPVAIPTDNEKPAPCPLCGSENLSVSEIYGPRGGFQIECDDCGLESGCKRSGHELWDYWHTRPTASEPSQSHVG
jgi:transcription elongation factor Elf1